MGPLFNLPDANSRNGVKLGKHAYGSYLLNENPTGEAGSWKLTAGHRWTQFDHTDHTKILDTDSCVCYFHILIRDDFIGLSL